MPHQYGKRWLTVAAITVGSLLMAEVARSAGEEADQRLSQFFREYLDASFELRPLDATRLGDHRFDDRLDDVSPEQREQFAQLQRLTLAELPERVDINGLTPDGRIDYEIFRDELTRSLW